MKNKLNVMHFIHSLEIGGAENVVLSYLNFHDRSRFKPSVCCFKSGGRLEAKVKDAEIEIFHLNNKSKSLVNILKIYKIIRKNKIDIVHFHNPLPVFTGAPSAAIAGVPVRIITEHSIDYKGRLGNAMLIYKLIHRLIDAHIACSDEVMLSQIKQYKKRKFKVIHNGIDIHNFKPRPINYDLRKTYGVKKEEFVIGNIGNLTPPKGHSILLEAVKLLHKKGVPVHLISVGDGILKERLKNIVKNYDINDQVTFLGQRQNVSEIISTFDIIVSSSIREGLPISLLEGMACGKAVIATDIGGNKEVIGKNKCGILVPTNSASAIADAVCVLYKNKNLRKKYETEGLSRAIKKFSVTSMVKKTEQLYVALMKQKVKRK
jgi:glycosyltransferase involved in cell wall biosynthesis